MRAGKTKSPRTQVSFLSKDTRVRKTELLAKTKEAIVPVEAAAEEVPVQPPPAAAPDEVSDEAATDLAEKLGIREDESILSHLLQKFVGSSENLLPVMLTPLAAAGEVLLVPCSSEHLVARDPLLSVLMERHSLKSSDIDPLRALPTFTSDPPAPFQRTLILEGVEELGTDRTFRIGHTAQESASLLILVRRKSSEPIRHLCYLT